MHSSLLRRLLDNVQCGIAAEQKPFETPTEADYQAQEAYYREQQIGAALEAERNLKRSLLNRVQEMYGNVRVFCRIRPVLRHERKAKALNYEIVG